MNGIATYRGWTGLTEELLGAAAGFSLSVCLSGAALSIACMQWNWLRREPTPASIRYAPAIAAGGLVLALSNIGGR